jgi:hypothetical protein
MALADAISTPQVGKTMLTTFGVLAEENRKRKELELGQEKAMQNLLLREAGLQLRDNALNLQATKAATGYEIAMQKIALATTEAERKAAVTEVELAKKNLELESKQGDMQAAREAAELLSVPDKDGTTLHQRLLSDDQKVAAAAMREFVGASSRLQGKGAMTKSVFDSVRKGFNDNLRGLEGQREAEIAAQREARLQKSAESGSARADATLAERKRHNMASEANATARTQQAGATGKNAKTGEWFPGGNARIKMSGTTMTLDQIRETLAAGGQTAEALKRALKTVDAGTNEDGSPKESWVDDATISELEKQGKTILQHKQNPALPKNPTSKQLNNAAALPTDDPLQQDAGAPSDIDLIFERPVPAGAAAPMQSPLPGMGAAAVAPAQDFFGLPRQLSMS